MAVYVRANSSNVWVLIVVYHTHRYFYMYMYLQSSVNMISYKYAPIIHLSVDIK